MSGRFFDELKYAGRTVRRWPASSAAVVLTLALGIGASTAMFSVTYGVLYRPLPYRDAGQLVTIRTERRLEGAQRPVRSFFPLADLTEWQSAGNVFDAVAFYSPGPSELLHNGFAETIESARVSERFFMMLDGPMESGRGLTASTEDRAAAVISHRLSERLFGAGDALGRTVSIGARAYEVIGVTRPAFQLPTPDTDAWLPAVDLPCCSYAAIARLKPLVSHAEAGAAVDGLLTALAAKSPRVYAGARGRVVPIRDELMGDVRLALWILMASAGVLLAVACVNAANLLLVRNMARSRETAVRVALGASRVQLLQQSFAEAVIVVAAAGAAGLAAAQLLVRTLLSLGRSGVPRLDAESVRLDRPVFLFALGIVAIAAGVMTFLPAFRSEQPMVTLKGTVPAGSAGPKQRRLQNALVVIQLAASVVLLVGAGLLGRSLIELMTADVGVQTDHVATVAVNLSYQRKLADAQQVAEIQALVARIRSLPNVTAVGAGASLPPKASTIRLTLKRSGDTVDYQATAVPATPGYFHALGIRLLDGRLFSDGDTDGARQVMIMTADTARRFFGSSHPIGRTMTLPVLRNGVPGTASVTLVGVVSDIKYSGLDAPPDDAVFRPLAQQPWPLLFVVARTTGNPSLVVSALPHEIAAVDPGIAVSSSGTLDEIVAAEAAQPRFRTVLLAATSLLTLSIAALGLYGAMAHAVSRRTREFGVRMALGATGTDLIAGVVLDGARLAGAGLALGLIGSVAAARAMVGLLYETKPADALSVGVASGVLLVVALVATYLPARKAAHLDPSAAFRAE